MADLSTIGVVGGTGSEGGGLALRWARAGYAVVVGSRSADKAARAADDLNKLLPPPCPRIRGMSNGDCAAAANVIVLTVPFAAQQQAVEAMREQLRGKILVDVTVPLVPPKVGRVQLPPGGSAVEAMQRLLGQGVRIVSAFQNVTAQHLRDLDHAVDCDVLVCGDDEEARELVVTLAEAAGLRAWHAGPLANSAAAEALTSVLISINRRYKVTAAGIRITGL